ncbi:Eukaryotic translation initiation factor 3 subunit A, partial [Orchesella cincta]
MPLKRRLNLSRLGSHQGIGYPLRCYQGEKYRSFSEKVSNRSCSSIWSCVLSSRKHTLPRKACINTGFMCQSVNVGLLEKVIRSYIRMAEDRTEAAKALIEQKTAAEASTESISIVEVDDLDNLSMADMTLLNVVTEEQAQERSGRTALIPWVKFLWESYTQCLDLLRNNPRLENLYHDIAQMEALRTLEKHFDDIINRQGSQMNSIDFSSPKRNSLTWRRDYPSWTLLSALELWQDAYKAIEDIHLLMNQSKKSQTRMMAYYYQKAVPSGNLLFHAATLMKYYLLCKDMKKNVSADELQKNASQVVLATMAIPFPVLHPEFERFVETDKGMLEKSQKLATLLFLPQPPTRASIIRDISRHGILTNASNPSKICTKFWKISSTHLVSALMLRVAENAAAAGAPTDYMEQYIDPLREVTLVRLIKQISQVYQTIDYDHLMNMTVFSNQIQLEQILVDAVRYTDMQITVDHRSNCIKFGASLAEASREDLPEGPHLQIMPSETVRLQLVNIMDCLQDTVEMISPVQVSYHRSLIARHKVIAERREELERSAVDKEYEEKHAEQMIKQQMMMEAKRLETERDEREKKKVKSEKLGEVEWEAHDAQRIAHLIEERKIAVVNRDRMKRMREDKDKFLKNLLDARRDLFMEKLNEFEKSFRAEKTRRMAERKDQRKQERRRKHDEEKARHEAVRKA